MHNRYGRGIDLSFKLPLRHAKMDVLIDQLGTVDRSCLGICFSVATLLASFSRFSMTSRVT